MPVLDLTSAIADATGEPLRVELGGGRVCFIKAPSALSAEAVEKLRELVEEWMAVVDTPGAESDSSVLSLALRIPALVMDSKSYDTWLQAQPPLSAFAVLMEELNKFYASAGTLGEEPASQA